MSDDLTADQRTLVDVWEHHMAAEFEAKSIDGDQAVVEASDDEVSSGLSSASC